MSAVYFIAGLVLSATLIATIARSGALRARLPLRAKALPLLRRARK